VPSALSSNPLILAIDHGTSGIKAAIVTAHGEVIDFEFEKTSTLYLEDGGVEQNPNEWWDAIGKAAKRLLESNITARSKIAAICCSSTFSSTVAVDAQGRPVMNSLTWMDSRSSKVMKRLMRGAINIQGYSISNLINWIPKTGGAPALSGKDDIGHTLYIKHERPELYDKTHMFLGAKDFLNLKLTGKYAASYDSAALFWIADIRNINMVHYDQKLIARLGLDKNKFPPLMRSIDLLGPLSREAARHLGLAEEVQVVAGSADLQTACIGSGAVRDFESHLYVGTSSWILCHVPFKKTDIFHVIASMPSAIPGKYFCANEQDMAGGCIDFLINNLLFHKNAIQRDEPPEDIYAKLDEISVSIRPGSEGVIFTPWLNGEKTPVEESFLRGGFHNISMKTNMDHLVRAVFEGVAYNAKWVLQYVEKFTKRKMEPLNMIGGGAQSNIWPQIFADVLGRTIRVLKNPIQANARGAGLIASVALGCISFDDIPNFTQYENIYEPDKKNSEFYDRQFVEFLQIYKGNKSIYRRLN